MCGQGIERDTPYEKYISKVRTRADSSTYEVLNVGLAAFAVRMATVTFLLSAVPAMTSFAAVVHTIRPLSHSDQPIGSALARGDATDTEDTNGPGKVPTHAEFGPEG